MIFLKLFIDLIRLLFHTFAWTNTYTFKVQLITTLPQ